jgi:hypothetical protein
LGNQTLILSLRILRILTADAECGESRTREIWGAWYSGRGIPGTEWDRAWFDCLQVIGGILMDEVTAFSTGDWERRVGVVAVVSWTSDFEESIGEEDFDTFPEE